MHAIMRAEDEVSSDAVKAMLSSVGLTEMGLPWNVDKVDADLQSFMEFKTGGDAQSTCEAHECGGFESFRLLNLEYDPIAQGTKGAMMTNIVTMMKRTAKSPK